MFGSKGKDAGLQSDEKDPERMFKLKECCDMLLAGGYFRARIPTLSAFDKVVGGMVWSITGSGVDVDVDIIFTENSTIGQRIRLSDQLVKALIRMRSPHPLQSHQIQGLDYDHLFPVIQWLVRAVIEHRRLTGDLVRAQSLSHFSKSYALPQEVRSKASQEGVEELARSYARPQRKFRKKVSPAGVDVFDTASARTEGTLLEYGEQLLLQSTAAAQTEEEEREAKAQEKAAKQGGAGQRNALISKFEQAGGVGGGSAASAASASGGGAASSEKDAAARAEAEKRELARLENLRQQLSETTSGSKISGVRVGTLVGLQSDEIRRAAQEYEEKRVEQERELEAAAAAAAEGGFSGVGGARGAEQSFQRQLEALKRKVAQATETSQARQAATAEVEAKSQALQAQVAKVQKRLGKIAAETAKLEALESNAENQSILTKLRQLVQLNEELRAQEGAFKENCARQRREMKEMLAKLDPTSTAAADGEDEETARMRAVERMHASESESLSKLRRVLARKNQEIASLHRRIDEVPTRAELLQYERRFVELYELSAEKHAETKKFYELYNSTQASHDFMQTEVKLLNSIIDAFPAAVLRGTPASRAEFLQKLESILAGVAGNKAHVAEESAAVAARAEALAAKYNGLLETQRHYFKAVKDFQDQCFLNGFLEEQLAQMSVREEETVPASGLSKGEWEAQLRREAEASSASDASASRAAAASSSPALTEAQAEEAEQQAVSRISADTLARSMSGYAAVKAAAAAAPDLTQLDMGPHLMPLAADMDSRPVVYHWRVNVKNKAATLEFFKAQVTQLTPQSKHKRTVKRELSLWQTMIEVAEAATGPFLPYFGESVAVNQRYKNATFESTFVHRKLIEHLKTDAGRAAFSFEFGVLAVGPPSLNDVDLKRTSLAMEAQLGELVGLDADAIKNRHVINRRLLGLAWGIWADIRKDRDLCLDLAKMYYSRTEPCTAERLAARLEEITGDEVTPQQAMGLVGHVLKKYREEVYPEGTHTGRVRAPSGEVILSAEEEAARMIALIEVGWIAGHPGKGKGLPLEKALRKVDWAKDFSQEEIDRYINHMQWSMAHTSPRIEQAFTIVRERLVPSGLIRDDWPKYHSIESRLLEEAEDKERPYDCTVCKPTTELNSRTSLRKHMESGLHMPLSCPKCGREATSVTSYTAHARKCKEDKDK